MSIGSYPFFDEKTGPNTNLVIRSRDAGHLAAAKADVEAMLVAGAGRREGQRLTPSVGLLTR